MRPRPAVEITICLHIPELVRCKSHQNSIYDQAAIVVAGEAVTAAHGFDLGNVLGEQQIEQTFCIRAFELDRKFPGMKDCGFLTQLPVAVFDALTIVFQRHEAAIIDRVTWSHIRFQSVKTMATHIEIPS